MFDGVAARYDIMNDLLSFGQTKAWRKVATGIIAPKKGMKILDIAAGTGSSSRPLADAGAEVIPADFSQGMLDAGKKRHPDLKFTLADALKSFTKPEVLDGANKYKCSSCGCNTRATKVHEIQIIYMH